MTRCIPIQPEYSRARKQLNTMSITAIILTYNEEKHIARAIRSLEGLATRVYVIDSGSSDLTTTIANGLGATVLINPFVTQSQQFNWSLNQIDVEAEWIFRLDADEIVSPRLKHEINEKLSDIKPSVHGVYISRRVYFLGRPIRWGGIYPIQVLRLFRYGMGHCEKRWMDEHIIVQGETALFSGDIVDDNLNSLSWWTEKHNSYASREVVDILNHKYKFMINESIADLRLNRQATSKRWIKEKVYARLPGGTRAIAYFLYRYILRLGFLDGKEGAAFHILQGFWYRYLVDMKLHEVQSYIAHNDVDVRTAISKVLNIDVASSERS